MILQQMMLSVCQQSLSYYLCVRISDKVLDSFILPLATDSAQYLPILFHRCIMI